MVRIYTIISENINFKHIVIYYDFNLYTIFIIKEHMLTVYIRAYTFFKNEFLECKLNKDTQCMKTLHDRL